MPTNQLWEAEYQYTCSMLYHNVTFQRTRVLNYFVTMPIAQAVGKSSINGPTMRSFTFYGSWAMGLMVQSGGHFALLLYHLWTKLNHLACHTRKIDTKKCHFKCKLWYKGFYQIVNLKRYSVNHMDKKVSPASYVPKISGFRPTWNAKSQPMHSGFF